MIIAVVFIGTYSCSKDEVLESVKGENTKIENRSNSSTQVYDLRFVYDSLNFNLSREGYFTFVDNYRDYLSTGKYNSSILTSLEQNNVYPCWYCGESEYFGYHNYYVPTYNLETKELHGILILEERNNIKSHTYLSKTLVDFLFLNFSEPYSQYWNDVMSYFEGNMGSKNIKDYLKSPMAACYYSYTTGWCVCEGTSDTCSGTSSPTDCPPTCDGEGEPDGEGDGETEGPLTTADISYWVYIPTNGTSSSGSGTGTNSNNPSQNWDDLCNSFDGNLDFTNTDGEFVIDEATGEIALMNPLDLYVNQVQSFIDTYNMPYSAEELIGIVGEKCAVSNISEVVDCIKCHFISPLNLSENNSFDLADNFDIVVECIDSEVPDCEVCNLAINELASFYGIEVSNSLYMQLTQISSCDGEGFEEEVFNHLADIYVDLALENLSTGHRIRLLDCNSFQWELIGNGWVSCLEPTNMEVEIGNTGIDFFIDLGCLSYTIPNSRENSLGQVIQIISYEDASSCGAMASNLASVAVKMFMTIIPDYKLFDPDFITKHLLKKIYKKAYAEAMEKTSCGNNPNLNLWNGSIATCNNSNCPSGSSTPVYSDDLIEVTEESILGECH